MSHKWKFLYQTIWILAGLPVLFLSFNFTAFGQTNISGVINNVSSQIDAVYSYNTTLGNFDSVRVKSVSGFSVGDTVLVHMTVGADVLADEFFEGAIGATNNSGKYAIFILKGIDAVNKYLILNSTLPDFKPLVPGEFGQILKVPTYKRAKITGTLTCNAYDTANHNGGILALIVKQGLIFEGNINVNGKGFPGADPDTNHYSGDCSITDPLYSDPYLASSFVNYSALKGYSFTYTTHGLPRGFGALNNGGGGGSAKFSGGGGGANFGNGGNGGFESESCGSSPQDIGGRGGKAPKTIFYESTEGRISLGGGGGTSLQDLPSFKATSGGDGGGIVIIICDSLIGNKNIYAMGDSVTAIATAGGGGGGGGGAVIMHVNKYSNSPKIYIAGGVGGSISGTAPLANGPGGGGGAGVVWHNGATMGSELVNRTALPGNYKLDPFGAKVGGNGIELKNLRIPIRGFLINYIPDADTICFNVPPNTINAAPAIGGADTVLTYTWLQSTDAINWLPADSTFDEFTYTPRVSTNTTTYYRRFVTDGFIEDSSNIVKMYVLPSLANNVVKPDITTKFDTIVCSGITAGTLKQISPMTGGNGSYRFMWEKSTENTFGFATRDTVGASAAYPTPVLNDTTWFYRRTAYSGPRTRMESSVLNNTCKSTSNIIKIVVLPEITNNILSPNQEICTTRTPVKLTGAIPVGGDNSFTYKWQQKTGPSSWTDVSNDSTYQPPALTANQEYRRIIFSGNANTCKDTSLLTEGIVLVMPVITNNTIDPIIQNILCSGTLADTLTATIPSGGNGSYNYYWQKDNVDAPGGNDSSGFSPGILTANAAMKYNFRRYVSSGINPDSAQLCWSLSPERTISILDTISNNILTAPKTIWCQGKTPDDIAGTLPLNGDGVYAYSWIDKLPATSWEIKTEVSLNYSPGVISSDISYRRIVKSGLNGTCIDTSNSISFLMQDSILNNTINNGETVFVCFDEDSILQATSVTGGLTGGDGTNYTYLWSQSHDSLGIYADASHSVNGKTLYLTEPIDTSWYFKRYVKSGDCENSSAPVKIVPLPIPELTGLTVSTDEICFNELDKVLSVNIKSGLLPYVISFEDGQGFIDSRIFTSGTETIKPQMSNPAINPGFADFIFKVVSIKDSKNCYSKPSGLSAALRVFTIPEPQLIGDIKVLSCSETLQLSVNRSIGSPSWHLSNNFGISAANTTTPDVNLTAVFSTRDSAYATLAYVEDIANCHSDSIFVEAVLYNNPDPITDTSIYKVTENIPVVAGDPVVIYISDNQQFKGETIISGIPSWKITGGGVLSDTDSIITTVSDLDQENPTFLEYIISNGICPVSSRTIKIERHELLVYDGFSPNDDGKNDELWAVGLADEDVDFKFQIFSSSGSFIREITRKDIIEDGYDYGENRVLIWDGTTKLGGTGNFIPDGTYYYVLIVTYHGEPFNARGYIIVKR